MANAIPMRLGLSVLTACLSALALAACPSAVTTTTSYDVLFRSGVLGEFGYAATAGEMPVVVVGNRFDAPKPMVDEAVIAAMQGHNRGAAVRFVPAPAEIAQFGTGYALVLLLNAGPGVGADLLCARRGTFSPPIAGGGTTLLAVFCGNADARSWAYSATGPVASPDDPLFRALVAQTTFLMIPPRDDDWSNSSFL